LSKKEAINLGEEIGYLKSYIELQRIRLNNRLDYCIDISIDIDFTPTLFAQDQNLNQYYQAENVAQMDLWLIDNFSDPN
jgi:hypothetical protein